MHLASLSLLSSGVVECKVGSWRSSFLIDLNYLLGSTTSISVLLLLLYFDFSCPQSFLPELMMLSIEVRTCQNLKPRKKRGRGEDVPKMCIFYQRRFWLVYYVLCDRSSVLKILWLWSSTLLTAATFLPAIQPDFTAVRLGHSAKTAIKKKKKASTSSSRIVIVVVVVVVNFE